MAKVKTLLDSIDGVCQEKLIFENDLWSHSEISIYRLRFSSFFPRLNFINLVYRQFPLVINSSTL